MSIWVSVLGFFHLKGVSKGLGMTSPALNLVVSVYGGEDGLDH